MIILKLQKLKDMNTINIRKFSLACALTGVLLYLGCIVVMLTAGREGTITFFNSLLHGLDVTSVIRMSVPWWEAVIGIVETFILSWLIGACISGFYNATTRRPVR